MIRRSIRHTSECQMRFRSISSSCNMTASTCIIQNQEYKLLSLLTCMDSSINVKQLFLTGLSRESHLFCMTAVEAIPSPCTSGPGRTPRSMIPRLATPSLSICVLNTTPFRAQNHTPHAERRCIPSLYSAPPRLSSNAFTARFDLQARLHRFG